MKIIRRVWLIGLIALSSGSAGFLILSNGRNSFQHPYREILPCATGVLLLSSVALCSGEKRLAVVGIVASVVAFIIWILTPSFSV